MLDWLRSILTKQQAAGPLPRAESAPATGQSPSAVSAGFIEAGLAKSQSGDHAAALHQFELALKAVPDSSIAHSHAGAAAIAIEDLEAAEYHFSMALHFDPGSVPSVLGRASALERQGSVSRAILALETFLERNPGNPRVLFALAKARYSSGVFEQAMDALHEVLAMDPQHAESLNFMGLILAREHGDLDAGEAAVRRAIKFAPRSDLARSNLGWILAEQGRLDEALESFDAVLKTHPEDKETALMRAHACLKHGRFAEGWRDFEARHHSPLAIRRIPAYPECRSISDLAGRHVFVCAEQGLGDQIMFASCLPDLLGLAATCVLECDHRLASLFQRSFPGVAVLPQGAASTAQPVLAARIDTQVAIGSLPGYFRDQLQSFPVHSGYLKADEKKVAEWRDRFERMGPGPYVGISWRGGAPTTRRQLRSIPLAQWRSILLLPGRFFSLQYGECATEVAQAKAEGLTLEHWPDVLADYDETAAMLGALDMVISVCTAAVHLAGAMGVPVWILAPHAPEWRYLAQGETLPWYPSARVFRQARHGEWKPVIEAVTGQFSTWALAGHRG